MSWMGNRRTWNRSAVHVDHLEAPAGPDNVIARLRQFMQLRQDETSQGHVVAGGRLAHPDEPHHVGEEDGGIAHRRNSGAAPARALTKPLPPRSRRWRTTAAGPGGKGRIPQSPSSKAYPTHLSNRRRNEPEKKNTTKPPDAARSLRNYQPITLSTHVPFRSHGRFFTRIPRMSRLFMKVRSDSYDFRISRHFGPSRFFMTFGPILRMRSHETVVSVRLPCCSTLKTRIVWIGSRTSFGRHRHSPQNSFPMSSPTLAPAFRC